MRYFDARWGGANGIGRFSKEVAARLGYHPIFLGELKFSLLSFLRTSYQLSKLLLTNDAMVFFSPGMTLAWWPSFLKSKSSNFAVTIHDVFFLDRNNGYGPWRHYIFKHVIRFLILRYDKIFTVSDYSKKQISLWLGSRYRGEIVMIGNGNPFSDMTRPKASFQNKMPLEGETDEYILFVGNNKPHKNFRRLVQAFKLIKAKTINKDLLLVAVGVDQEPGIVALSGLSDGDLWLLYRRAKAVVIPSVDEGFCYPLVEALHAGANVIHSGRGALSEVGGASYVQFDVFDVRSIAHALETSISVGQALSKRHQVPEASCRTWDEIATEINRKLT